MSGPVGHTFIYNLIIIFIVIIFGFLAGTMSYYKAFKINNRIVSAIEKFEGYNSNTTTNGAKQEIDRVLGNFGYSREPIECSAEYKKMKLVQSIQNNNNTNNDYRYCIYIDKEKPNPGDYYQYGVLTYMNINLPFINRINIPVFTRTNRIYKFTNTNQQSSF